MNSFNLDFNSEKTDSRLESSVSAHFLFSISDSSCLIKLSVSSCVRLESLILNPLSPAFFIIEG